jgi:hypothetical protein
MILGIHAASIGEKLPLVAKVIENLSIITNNAAITRQMASKDHCHPTFLWR